MDAVVPFSVNSEGEEMGSPFLSRNKKIQPRPQKPRVQSLDVLRALAIAGMIIVHTQGDPDHVYKQLDEDKFDGLTFAGFIFPLFLFIQGVTIPMVYKDINEIPTTVQYSSFNWSRRMRERVWYWLKIIKRFLLMFIIGLLLNLGQANFHFSELRIMGVLQRLSICYCVWTALFLSTPLILQRAFVVICLAVYPIILYTVPLTCEEGTGTVAEFCNAAEHIDRQVFGKSHMQRPTDPEGIISTLPALFTCFVGVECGRFLVAVVHAELERKEAERIYENTGRQTTKYISHGSHPNHHEPVMAANSSKDMMMRLIIMALLLIGIGVVIGNWMIYSRPLWTISFAFVTGGAAAAMMVICYLAIDSNPWVEKPVFQILLTPFRALGMNSLFVYIGVNFIVIMFQNWITMADGSSFWQRLNGVMFSYWQGELLKLGSLCFSFIHLLFWWLVAGLLYWRKIFIKI